MSSGIGPDIQRRQPWREFGSGTQIIDDETCGSDRFTVNEKHETLCWADNSVGTGDQGTDIVK